MFHLATFSATVAVASVTAPIAQPTDHLRFVENRGQWNTEAQFLLQTPGQDVWVTRSGLALDFHRIESRSLSPISRSAAPRQRRFGHVVRVDFAGASSAVRPIGVGAGTALRNWILPGKLVEGVREYREARLVNVVPGVTARYYLDGGAARYDAILAPGTDPNSVVLNYQGANNLRIGPDGTLMYDTVLGTVKEQKLFVYQDVNGVRQPVEAAFRLVGKNRVGFALGRFDVSKPLTIDPQIMTAWTYLGGTNSDRVGSIARHNGDVIISGITGSSAFPITVGSYDTVLSGGQDVFVTRLRQSLTTNALVYSTFIGGSNGFEFSASVNNAFASSVAKVYPNGDVMVGLTTSSSLPVIGGFDSTRSGTDGYLARLNGALGTLKNSTYFGGSNADNIHDIDINPLNGDVAIGLVCRSSNMFTDGYVVGGSSVGTKPDSGGGDDAFVAVMNQNLDQVKMGTYFGGTGMDRVWGLAYGRDYQTVLLAGGTASTNLSPNFGSVGSASTGYVVRYRLGNGTQNGARLALHTFGGNTSETNVTDIVVDMVNDRPIVVGYTRDVFATSNFSTIAAGAPGFDQFFRATTQARAFAMRFSPKLDRITGWTYLQGTASTGNETARAVAVQPNGTIHIGGRTDSGDYPLVSTQLTNISSNQVFGSNRSFVTRLSNGFAHIGSSVFGAGTTEINEVGGIVLDGPYNDLYVAGTTALGINPPVLPGFTPYRSTLAGNNEAYVARIAFFTDPLFLESSSASAVSGQSVSFRVTLNAPVVAPGGQNVVFQPNVPGVLRLSGNASSVTINIPQGQSRGSVQVLALPVSSPTPVTMQATSSGTTVSRTVTINP